MVPPTFAEADALLRDNLEVDGRPINPDGRQRHRNRTNGDVAHAPPGVVAD